MLAARRMMIDRNRHAAPPVSYSWQADSLSLSDGALVTAWTDAVAGFTLTAGSGVEPTFKTAIQNGLPVLRTTVAGKQLFATPIPAALQVADFTYLAVVKPTSAGAGFGPGRAAVSIGGVVNQRAGIAVDSSSQAVGFGGADLAAGGSILGAFHLVTIRRDTAAGTLIVRVDGIQVGVDSSLGGTPTWSGGVSIFDAQTDYPNTSWVGDIGQVDVYTAALSDPQVSAAEAALNTKWGL